MKMSLEQIIARLVGQADPAEAGSRPVSPAQGLAVSQRLRAIVDDAASAGAAQGQAADRGPAADALRLAAYLDGSMTDSERDAFEAELARSPARRDDLIAAVAWIEEITLQHQAPPAAATARAIALERGAPAAAAKHGAGFAGWIEWLLPRPRLAMATSALAMFAIVAVGLDIALHTNPQLRAVIQQQQQTGPGIGIPDESTRQPPERTFLPALPGDAFVLTADIINALIAYQGDPSPARRQEVLTALVRAGATPVAADGVRTILFQAGLMERLTQRTAPLPTRITVRHSMDGSVTIGMVN
jgi:hypothetical protein